jgi:hypothetical protein
VKSRPVRQFRWWFDRLLRSGKRPPWSISWRCRRPFPLLWDAYSMDKWDTVSLDYQMGFWWISIWWKREKHHNYPAKMTCFLLLITVWPCFLGGNKRSAPRVGRNGWERGIKWR